MILLFVCDNNTFLIKKVRIHRVWISAYIFILNIIGKKGDFFLFMQWFYILWFLVDKAYFYGINSIS